MNLTSLITDNISEILAKIIEFTQIRQTILTKNINNVHQPGFIPKDLAVHEFCELLNHAIDYHTQNQQLVLRDTENIKFGANGSFEAKPLPDKYAENLLKKNRDEYLELQINKLMENSLNQRVAAELFKQKRETISVSWLS